MVIKLITANNRESIKSHNFYLTVTTAIFLAEKIDMLGTKKTNKELFSRLYLVYKVRVWNNRDSNHTDSSVFYTERGTSIRTETSKYGKMGVN